MVELFKDGFDKYGPVGMLSPTVASMLTAGEWNSVTASPTIVAPLSATGQALSVGGSIVTNVTKSFANTTRIIGGVRFASPLSGVSSDCGIVFADGVSQQFSITITRSTGTVIIRSGAATGTAIQTSASTVSANSTHYLEWDVTVGAAGAYQVWLDGVSILSGTGNTRAGTANNYCNSAAFGSFAVNASAMTIDDLYLFDSTGSVNNAVLLTNPIVETAFPTGDAQTQWSNGATIIGQDYSTTAVTNAPGANFLALRTFTPAVNMNLQSVSLVPKATSGAAKFKAVVYGPVSPIGAHRYWRLNGQSASTFVDVAELQFRSVAGTPLLFSGGTASASTTSGGSVAANAADNNTATEWAASSGSIGWWQYDYGVSNTFTPAQITITAQNSTSIASYSPWSISCDLQYSDDNINFFTVAALSPSAWSNGQTQTFTLSSRPTIAGSPGSALIATGTEIIGAINGSTLTLPFGSGQALTGGIQYAIGIITDTSVALQEVDTSALGRGIANTYSSGAPAVLPTVTTSLPSWQFWGNCTGATTNWDSINNNPPIDDIAYAYSSTVGQEDHQTFPALSNTPAAVYSVSYKARTKRSDSGTRTADVRCVSGGANSPGTASGFTPGTSFGWLDTNFETDPNTGIAWTGSGVNAAQAGVKVAS